MGDWDNDHGYQCPHGESGYLCGHPQCQVGRVRWKVIFESAYGKLAPARAHLLHVFVCEACEGSSRDPGPFGGCDECGDLGLYAWVDHPFSCERTVTQVFKDGQLAYTNENHQCNVQNEIDANGIMDFVTGESLPPGTFEIEAWWEKTSYWDNEYDGGLRLTDEGLEHAATLSPLYWPDCPHDRWLVLYVGPMTCDPTQRFVMQCDFCRLRKDPTPFEVEKEMRKWS